MRDFDFELLSRLDGNQGGTNNQGGIATGIAHRALKIH